MSENRYPFVTIIIPARNEGDLIGGCLRSLKRQSYPKDRFEIIVVDNGSNDNTIEMTLKYGITPISAPDLKIGGVRNVGVKQSNSLSEVIAFIDADCIAPRDWLERSVHMLTSDKKIGGIGGYFRVPRDANWIQVGWAPPLNESDAFVSTLATGSFLLRRSTFELIGGFNEGIDSGEDMEMSSKIKKNGFLLVKTSAASVWHLGYPPTIKTFFIRQIKQSKDYFKSKREGLDTMFIVVSIFSSSLILSLFFVSFALYDIALWSFTLLMSCWFIVFFKKIKSVKKRYMLKYLHLIATISGMYLLARFFGLVIATLIEINDRYLRAFRLN